MQFASQGHQLDDLLLGGSEFVGDDTAEAVLDGSALPAVPGEGQVADLVERAAELLGAGDERESVEGSVVVQPVSGGGPGRLGK